MSRYELLTLAHEIKNQPAREPSIHKQNRGVFRIYYKDRYTLIEGGDDPIIAVIDNLRMVRWMMYSHKEGEPVQTNLMEE